MCHAARRVDPGKGPAVGVEHRQGPEIPVGRREMLMNEGPHDVHVGVAMGDHHALGPRRRAAGVIDGQQVGFGDFDRRVIGRMRRQGRLVIGPALARPFQRHEMLDAGQPVPDAVDRLEIIRVGADHRRPAMVDDVLEILRQQPVVDRHQHRADLRHRVVAFQMGMRVRRDIGDPVALAHAHSLQRRGPTVAAVQEFRIGEAQIAIDDRFLVAIKPPRPPCELHRGQCDFHRFVPLALESRYLGRC